LDRARPEQHLLRLGGGGAGSRDDGEANRPAVMPGEAREVSVAVGVARGTARLLCSLGLVVVSELRLTSGRRADLVALGGHGQLWIIEVKSSVEDLRVDHKWQFYRTHCDRLFFATALGVPTDIFPQQAGLILADGFGASIVREAPEHRVSAAIRRSMMLRFAHVAARRLQALHDPEGPYLNGG
jgi:hypothetical protein